jgi:hypothetical protein
MFVVKVIFPSTGYSMNFWHHHKQLRKLILEHTSIQRKGKSLKIFYFSLFHYSKTTGKYRVYTVDVEGKTKEPYIAEK